MYDAFTKAIAQLGDPRLQRMALRTFIISLAITIALSVLFGWALTVQFDDMLSTLPDGMRWLIEGAGWLASLVLVCFFFPAIATAVLGIFLDEVVDAVESRHYPELGPPNTQPLRQIVFASIMLFGTALVLNLLALPLYFIPVVGYLTFLFINGWLLGREYFEMVALRRVSRPDMVAQRARNRGRVLLCGIVFAALLAVPVVNLIAPVLAAAMMVHLYRPMAGAADRSAA